MQFGARLATKRVGQGMPTRDPLEEFWKCTKYSQNLKLKTFLETLVITIELMSVMTTTVNSCNHNLEIYEWLLQHNEPKTVDVKR